MAMETVGVGWPRSTCTAFARSIRSTPVVNVVEIVIAPTMRDIDDIVGAMMMVVNTGLLRWSPVLVDWPRSTW
jgi:hypothetical protein